MTIDLREHWEALLTKYQNPKSPTFHVRGFLLSSSEPVPMYQASGSRVPRKAELRRICSHDPAILRLELVLIHQDPASVVIHGMDTQQAQQEPERQTVRLQAYYYKPLDNPEEKVLYERYKHVHIVRQGELLKEIEVRHFCLNEGS